MNTRPATGVQPGMLLRTAAIATAIATLLVGCFGDPPPSNYPSQQVHLEDTTLGPGDVFTVRVFGQEKMSQDYSASAEGTISFPLIGVVEVNGKTPAALETELTRRLADGYLKEPQVSILVKEYKSKKVSVFGQVRHPGTLGYTEGMTIIEAVSGAGGFTPTARENAVSVTREIDPDHKTTYTVPVESIGKGKAKQFYMRPGDVIFVPPRRW